MNISGLIQPETCKLPAIESGAAATVATPGMQPLGSAAVYAALIAYKLQLAVASLGRTANRVMRFYAGLATLVAIHFAAAHCVAYWIGRPFQPSILETAIYFSLLLAPAFLCVLFVWRCLHVAFGIRPARPLLWLWNDAKQILSNPERFVGGAFVVFLLFVFIGSFSFLKDAISTLHPFSWDQTFAHLDRALHGGRNPVDWLSPFLGSPIATSAINFFYNIWFFVLYHFVFIAAFAVSKPRLRLQFLCAFVLTWGVGGNLLAVLLSSAGPVYYERLGLGTEFASHMTSLQDFAKTLPVWSLDIQEILWNSYIDDYGQVSGISAMPSMHVASSVLFALYGFRISRWAGWSSFAFAIVIALGSVHLGWHYAVDGYLGAIVAFGAWWIAGRLCRLQLSNTAYSEA